MRKLMLVVGAAAMILATAVAPRTAAAALVIGRVRIPAALDAGKPIEGAACRGWGRWCGPGFVRACGPYRCWCRPCY